MTTTRGSTAIASPKVMGQEKPLRRRAGKDLSRLLREVRCGRPRRGMSQPVSRVLSTAPRGGWAAIHLGPSSPTTSSRPTRALGRAALGRALSGLAPGGVYLAGPVTRPAGGLLHHPFTLTGASTGGLLSVALSRGSPRVAVSHHLALRSPDFPRHRCRGRPADSSAGQHTAPDCSPFATGHDLGKEPSTSGRQCPFPRSSFPAQGGKAGTTGEAKAKGVRRRRGRRCRRRRRHRRPARSPASRAPRGRRPGPSPGARSAGARRAPCPRRRRRRHR